MKILLVLLATGCLAVNPETPVNGCPKRCVCSFQRVSNDSKPIRVRCTDNLGAVGVVNLEPIAKQIVQLDLSKNQIASIANGQFKSFTFLRKLDLSSNRISSLPIRAFEGLENLERLKLNHNSIALLHRESIQGLSALKFIDLAGNQLPCQCPPAASVSRCAPPEILRGNALRAFKKDGILHCDVRSTEVVELRPSQNQVVFEGDQLRLLCRAIGADPEPESGVPAPYVSWFWGSENPSTIFKDVKIENDSIVESGILGSLLTIRPVQRNHSGQWNCLFVSGVGNYSRTLSVIVISEETQFCPHTVTTGNKGLYTWPHTVAGFKVELPCDFEGDGRAVYECDKSGSWKNLNTSACQYVRENSRTLYQLAQVDPRTVSPAAALDGARRLAKATVEDSEDISLLSRAVEHFVELVVIDSNILSSVVDALQGLMSASPKALSLAEQKDKACSKLVHILETVVVRVHGTDMAVEKLRVKHESFLGITCTWYTVPAKNDQPTRLFHCSTTNVTGLPSPSEKVVEASVQIPPVLLYQLEARGMPVWSDHQLLVAMFHDGRLFPYIQPPGSKNRYVVTSIVAGAKLAGLPDEGTSEEELSEPLVVVLRTNPDSRHAPRPVWWDSENGVWSERGCNASHRTGNLLYIRCSRLGYFGLLQAQPEPTLFGAASHLPPTAVLVSSAFLIFALIIAILSYVAPWPPLRVPHRTKHALVNTWSAMALLVFLYSVGVNQTEDVTLCQVIGLLLHYFSLSVILWMAVGLSTLHDQLQPSRTPTLSSEASDGSLEMTRPKTRPLVGLYLVGWGVGALVVGLSGALHLRQRHYTVPSAYCFLIPSAAAGSVGVPAVAIVLHLLLNALLVRCRAGAIAASAASAASKRQLSADVQLLGSDDEFDDLPTGQLSSALASLILFAFLWTSGALSAAAPLLSAVPDGVIVFSSVYACAAVGLALFILIVHCAGRSDVRLHWRSFSCRSRGRGVCDVHPATPAPLPVGSPPTPVRITPVPMSTPPPPATPANLSIRSTAELASASAVPVDPEVFYNAHQSGVARRFFRKQRRAAFHNGNGEMTVRRHGDGGGVERSAPVLTEGDDSQADGVDGERCVIGAAASEGSIVSSVGRRRRSRRSRRRPSLGEHEQRNCGTLPAGIRINEETCL